MKPEWLKIKIPKGESIAHYSEVNNLVRNHGLTTICVEGKCPNINKCWGEGTATFMVLGETCTRGCRFCAVKTARKGETLNPMEPINLANVIKKLDLKYVVITSVDRDDLEDQGSNHFAECVRRVREINPQTKVELLIPDFCGRIDLIQNVVDAKPDVIGHNIETVRELTKRVRDPRAKYDQSLNVLENIKKLDPEIYTKSSIMVGVGETEEQVYEAMNDLRTRGVDFLAIGQYLQPTRNLLGVTEFVHPEVFERYKQKGLEKGFKYVASGPFVRSSFMAGGFFQQVVKNQQGNQLPVLQ